jgi:predicted RNase H-like nuclease (RuvC/YqgF family)
MNAKELVEALMSTAKDYREGGQDLPGFEESKWGKLVLMLEEAAKAVETLQTYDRHMQDMQNVIDRLDKEISNLTEERDRVRRELCIRIAQEPEAFALSRKWNCFDKEDKR